MSFKFICDSCGKEEDGIPLFTTGIIRVNPNRWMQPFGWLIKDKKTIACNLECRDKLNERLGKDEKSNN